MIFRSQPGALTRRLVTLVAVAILVGTVAEMVGCRSREAQAKRELSLGINDYKDAKYESAIRHFQRAVALDPKSAEARKYLVAIASPPNTPDTRRYAEEAIREYERVLKSSPDQLEAVEGLAYLHFQLAHYDQAKRYYLRASELDPQNPEDYYSVAVIDWTQSYQFRMPKRVQLSLKQNAPLISFRECAAIREQNWARVEEGIAMLSRAVTLRADYTEAMAYLNLLYRERADIQCGNRKAYEMDLEQAEYWSERGGWRTQNERYGAPFKPSFGLSGAFQSLPRYSSGVRWHRIWGHPWHECRFVIALIEYRDCTPSGWRRNFVVNSRPTWS